MPALPRAVHLNQTLIQAINGVKFRYRSSQCSRSRRRPNLPPRAGGWPAIPSSPSTPNFCARPPITRCCASRRWPRPTRPWSSTRWRPASILSPFYALMADEKVMKVFHAARQDIEIVWHAAKLIPHPIFDTQVAAMVLGYGEFDFLRPTGAAHYRRRARQIAPLHRLDAPAACPTRSSPTPSPT